MLIAGAQLQQLAGQVRLGADAGRGVVVLVRLGLGLGDQVGDRGDAGVRLHEQHVRRVHQLRDRREVLDRIVGQVLEQAGIHRDRGRGEQQRMAVRIGARHQRHAGVAAAAGAIVDDHALAERLRQRLGQDARDDVGRPAGRERHDQRDGAGRIVRLGGRGRQRGQQRPITRRCSDYELAKLRSMAGSRVWRPILGGRHVLAKPHRRRSDLGRAPALRVGLTAITGSSA